MDEFNVKNAAAFLKQARDEARERADKTVSQRDVIIELAPLIREMSAEGFTLKKIHEMLVEKYGLKVSYSTFRGYLHQAALAKKEDNEGKSESD